MKNIKKNIDNEQGQALFEFIVFAPLFMFMSLIVYIIGSSINASINQIKITRGYYYFITANNSFAPNQRLVKQFADSGITELTLDSIAWSEKRSGQNSYATCFELPTFFGGNADDTNCDEPEVEDLTAKMIRIYTAYGTCGATFRAPPSGAMPSLVWMQKHPDGGGGGLPSPQAIQCIKN